MSVEVRRVDAAVVSVAREGDVVSASIDALVARNSVSAVVDSSRGARGPVGPMGLTGPPGQSVSVHWDTVPPGPSDGNVGDLWVVVEP